MSENYQTKITNVLKLIRNAMGRAETRDIVKSCVKTFRLNLEGSRGPHFEEDLLAALRSTFVEKDDRKPLATAVLLLTFISALRKSPEALSARFAQTLTRELGPDMLQRFQKTKNDLWDGGRASSPSFKAPLLAAVVHIARGALDLHPMTVGPFHEVAADARQDARMSAIERRWGLEAFDLLGEPADLFDQFQNEGSEGSLVTELKLAREKLIDFVETYEIKPNDLGLNFALSVYRDAFLRLETATEEESSPSFRELTRQDREFGVFIFSELGEQLNDKPLVLRKYAQIFSPQRHFSSRASLANFDSNSQWDMVAASASRLREPVPVSAAWATKTLSDMPQAPTETLTISNSSQESLSSVLSRKSHQKRSTIQQFRTEELSAAAATPLPLGLDSGTKDSASAVLQHAFESGRAERAPPTPSPASDTTHRFKDIFRKRPPVAEAPETPKPFPDEGKHTKLSNNAPISFAAPSSASSAPPSTEEAREPLLGLDDFSDAAEASAASERSVSSAPSLRVSAPASPAASVTAQQEEFRLVFGRAEELFREQLAAMQVQNSALLTHNGALEAEGLLLRRQVADYEIRMRASEEHAVQLRRQSEATAEVEAARHQAGLERVWEELTRSEQRREEAVAQLRAMQAHKAVLEQSLMGRDKIFEHVQKLQKSVSELRLQVAAWKRSQTQELRVFASGLRIFSARIKTHAAISSPKAHSDLAKGGARVQAPLARARLLHLRALTSDLSARATTELTWLFRKLTAFRNFVFERRADATQLMLMSESGRDSRRLQLLYTAAQHELLELRERVAELSKEKGRLQRGLVAFARGDNQSEASAQRMLRHLESENMGLAQLNRKFAAQALELKEKVIRLEASNQTPRLLEIVRQLEAENQQLCAGMQRRSWDHSPAKSSVLSAPRDSQIPVRMEASAVSGTAAMRRFDLLLSALESRRPQGARASVFEGLELRWQSRKEFAKQCLVGDYTLLNSRGLMLAVAERIIPRSSSFSIELQLSLTNTQDRAQRLGPVRLTCAAKDFATRGVSPEMLLLEPFEVRTLTATLELGAGYALDPAPVSLQLSSEAGPDALLLPIVLTKLFPPIPENPAAYAVLPSLAVVAEAAVSRRQSIDEDDLQRLFPHLVWLDDCSFVVKVVSMLGSFYLRVTLECFAVKLTAFASGPAQHIAEYVECVREILDNI